MPLNINLIRAALDKAESELGPDAQFNLVLARAQEIAPGSFGHLFDPKEQAQEISSDMETRRYRDHAIKSGLGELHDEDEAKRALEQYGVEMPEAEEPTEFEIKAAALVKAGDARDIDDAYDRVAAEHPDTYLAYMRTLK